MTLTLYGHPFSSFTEKVLTALYESDTPFVFRRYTGRPPAVMGTGMGWGVGL